ncbi:hypothetical protein [Sedimenticola sp.]|uniref:hypothetical protein n=1 Tax=Sedimenticola sp. TaxID=1940285 RepID=UPI003D0EAD09
MPPSQDIDLTGLVELIAEHRRKRDTGTLFLVTDRNETIKLVLQEGVIGALSYQSIRGQQALNPIRQINSCKARFYQGVKLLPVNPSLPSTDEIIELLGDSHNQASGQPLERGGKTPPRTATKNTLQMASSLDALRDILVEEATELLGPFARVLCDRYLETATDPPLQAQLQLALNALAQDINDPEKSRQLAHRVMQRIG